MRIPFDVISEARLVLTDDLVREALQKDKKARQERKKRRGEEPDGEDEQQTQD